MPVAEVRWDKEPAGPRAVVLVLHGGQEISIRRNSWWRVPVLWLRPFALVARRAGGGELAVARVRFALRGWNDEAASPLHDLEGVLDDVAARHPGVPIALVGHSMGGRVALNMLHDNRIHAVVGLAPWVDRGDVAAGAYRTHPGVKLLVIHGLADKITSPTASRVLVQRLQDQGVDARFVGLTGDKHAMLHRRRTWNRLLAAYLRETLLDALPRRALPRREQAALRPGSVTDI